MAQRKSAKKSAKRKSAKKVAKKSAAKRTKARRPARAARSSRRAAMPKVRPGLITHTELASADPAATRAWCQKVLRWKFGQSMPTPGGPYHMWQFDNGTGGGIRSNNPPEVPGSIPYCEVANIHTTFAGALAAGATEMMSPVQLPGSSGWIAIVAAPGGVAIGFWARK